MCLSNISFYRKVNLVVPKLLLNIVFIFDFYLRTCVTTNKRSLYGWPLLRGQMSFDPFFVFCLRRCWIKLPKQPKYTCDGLGPQFSISLLHLAPQFTIALLPSQLFPLCSLHTCSRSSILTLPCHDLAPIQVYSPSSIF